MNGLLLLVVLMSGEIVQPSIEIIRPQEGRQELFVASQASEAAFLGQAGGGKSYALLLDWLYDWDKPLHNGIIFRKKYKDLEDLVEKARGIFDPLGIEYNSQQHVWRAPSGARLWMSHLEQETTVFDFLGWELSWIGWDQLEQFTSMPYLYMFRSWRCADRTIGKRIRSTANPHGVGARWVWDRFYNKLKEGEVGWFVTRPGNIDVRLPDGEGVSRQWFFSDRSENRKLMDADPDYEKNLDMLPTEELRQAHKFGVLMISDSPDQLIKTAWLDGAIRGVDYVPGPKAFGLDYAEGGDMAVLYSGAGNQPTAAQEWRTFVPHPKMARLLRDFIREQGLYQVLGGIDTVGTGAGVYTALEDIDPRAAERVNPVRHKDEELAKIQAKQVRIQFQNLQDQMAWKLREDLMFGRIDLSVLARNYPEFPLLEEELKAFRFKENKLASGKLWISSSNDLRRATWPDGTPCLGRSPDRAKALMIWNYVREWTPEPRVAEAREETHDYGYTSGLKKRPATGSPFV